MIISMKVIVPIIGGLVVLFILCKGSFELSTKRKSGKSSKSKSDSTKTDSNTETK